MLAEQTRQDQITNDLANSSTPGYKADRSMQASFGTMLLENTANGQAIGSLGLGAQITSTYTDLTPAPLKQTDEPLDVALDGQGFFAVQTPAGPRYTRDGQFVVDGNGRLATATGYPVLDANGRTIALGGSDGLTIDSGGVIQRNGRTIATLGVASLTNPVKQGDTLFAGAAGPRPTGTAVRQGFLEGSGVDPTKAMVEMITSLRTYESDQKAISSIDETLQKGIQAGGV